MIGTSLSHHRIAEKLGRGSMGEVCRAEDTVLGRQVAIKVLPDEFAHDADRLARFEREAKLLASLNHRRLRRREAGFCRSATLAFLVSWFLAGCASIGVSNPSGVPSGPDSQECQQNENHSRQVKGSVEAADSVETVVTRRRIENEKLRNSPQFRRDLEEVGVSDEQIRRMDAKEVPLGFTGQEQFQRFKSELDEVMKKCVPDAEVGLKGTCTTFYSENPGKQLGHHWDADPQHPSDYDLNITSPEMETKLRNSGAKPSENYGVYGTMEISANYPELRRFSLRWKKELGRDINFVGNSRPQMRDATEYVLRSRK